MTLKIISPPRDFYFARGMTVSDLPAQEKQARNDFILRHEISKLQGDESFVRQVAEMSLNVHELEFDFFDTGIVVIDPKNPGTRFNLKMNPKFWDINERVLRIAECGIPGQGRPSDEDRTVSGSRTNLLPPLRPGEEAALALYPRDSMEDRTVRGSTPLDAGWDENEVDLHPEISMEDVVPTRAFPAQDLDRTVHGSRPQPQTYPSAPITTPSSPQSLQSQLDRFEEQLRRQKAETDRFERLLHG